MASDKGLVEHICDQIGEAGQVTSRGMFGEYGIYCDGRIVALVCDDRLFVKPTAGGRAFVGDVTDAPPYPGAKPYFLIEDRIDDREWLTQLVRITASEVPLPSRKPKRKRG